MKRCIMLVCSLCLIASTAKADDAPAQPDQSQVNAAYARLRAEQAAATQPATISAADLNGLRAELAQLKAENTALKSDIHAGNVAAKRDKQAADSTITTKYDRYHDETTVSTPDLEVAGNLEDAAVKDTPAKDVTIRVSFSAVFKGNKIAGEQPRYALCISLAASDGTPPADIQVTAFDGDKLRLIVDGRDHIALDIAQHAPDLDELILDADQIKMLAAAKSIEGQMGIIEFKLDPSKVTTVANFYRAATGGTPTPASGVAVQPAQADAANACPHAKQAATTQPANITVRDLNALRAEIARLKAENASRKARVAD